MTIVTQGKYFPLSELQEVFFYFIYFLFMLYESTISSGEDTLKNTSWHNKYTDILFKGYWTLTLIIMKKSWCIKDSKPGMDSNPGPSTRQACLVSLW